MQSNMDKINWFNLLFINKLNKLLLLFLVIQCYNIKMDAQSVQIWPEEISFNYEPGSTNDAITIRKDVDDVITVPEYIEQVSNYSMHFAYIAGQSHRKIKVKFHTNVPWGSYNFLVKATVVDGTGIGNICEFFIPACNDNTTTYILEFDGSVPGSVRSYTEFTLKWEATALPVSSSYCEITCNPVYTIHPMFVVLSAPQPPMEEPWLEVLYCACNWANGQTNMPGVVASITESLYNSGLVYDPGMHYTNGYSDFYLTDLLYDWEHFYITYMNCSDFANFLHVCTNALGANAGYVFTLGGVDYNYLLPAGNTIEPPGFWGYHQVGWYNSKVADASTKIDNDSNPLASPHTWKLSVGDMTWPEYIIKLSDIYDVIEDGQSFICDPTVQ
jgi:hypothetical protein